jgi:hypothetical protein
MRNGFATPRGTITCGNISKRRNDVLHVLPRSFCVFPIGASLSLMVPLLTLYRPRENGLDVIGHPIGRDFIDVWSDPQVGFRRKVETLFNIRAIH